MSLRVERVFLAIVLALCFVMLGMLSGCMRCTYNTQTHELTYERVGNQEVEDVEIELPDGAKVRLGRSKSETRIAEAIADAARAIRNASEVVK